MAGADEHNQQVQKAAQEAQFRAFTPGTAHAGRPIPALNRFPNSDTVTMVFPKELRLNLDDHRGVVMFEKGPQEVPVELKDHHYLRDNGVISYEEFQSRNAEKVNKLRMKASADQPEPATPRDETAAEESTHEAAEEDEENAEDVQPAEETQTKATRRKK